MASLHLVEAINQLKSLFGWNTNSRRRSVRQQPWDSAHRRLRVESLEDRRMLAVLTPTIFTDSNIAGAGSLRNAIISANNDTNASDTIQLRAGTYALTLQNAGGTQDNTSAFGSSTGDLDIFSALTTKTLIIQGAGRANTIINANTATQLLDRVFQIIGNTPGHTLNVQFKNLTINGGMAFDDGTAGTTPFTTDVVAEGGGILNQVAG